MEYSEKQIGIMEAAESLFAEKGYNGTSVREIAEKANVNLAMTSYYFGSKEKLLEALFDYRGEKAKLKLENIVQQPGLSALERVYLLVDLYIDKILSQQAFHRILNREQLLNGSGDIGALILAMWRRNLEIISRLIREGQESGAFSKDVDIPMMMTIMMGTANHLINTKQYYKEIVGQQEMPDDIFQEYIREKLSKQLKSLFKIILTHEV